MKTLKYKTLEGLLKTTTQMTVEQLFANRYHNNKKGWTNFKLYETELERAAKEVCKYIYDKNDIFIIFLYHLSAYHISLLSVFSVRQYCKSLRNWQYGSPLGAILKFPPYVRLRRGRSRRVLLFFRVPHLSAETGVLLWFVA